MELSYIFRDLGSCPFRIRTPIGNQALVQRAKVKTPFLFYPAVLFCL